MGKTPAVDQNISDYYYRVEGVTIEPPLSDAQVKAGSTDHFTLAQVKDEDVVFDPKEGVVVISNNVTSITSTHDPSDYLYNYAHLKSQFGTIVKLAHDNGSEVRGQVIVRDANNLGYFRMIANGSSVKVERAALAWPDGTTTPMEDGTCA